jgi:hypothetical protein
MKRLFAVLLICSPLALLAGCAMCCSPFDYAYPTYGGKWQRTDREHGRVGSLYTPHAGVKVEEGEAVGGEVIEGEYIEGDYVEGDYIEGEYIEGEIIEEGPVETAHGPLRLLRPVQ